MAVVQLNGIGLPKVLR